MYRPNRLKQRLAAGRKVLGCWSVLGDPCAAEILAQSGFDFLIFDQEHGLGEPIHLVRQLQAISATQTTSIVRVPWNDPISLKRVLDAGVEGVMIPSVETAQEAADAVTACRYPSAGRRGCAIGAIRASDYGMADDYAETAADNLMIICQIETVTAVENIDAIAAVEGVDLLFIGPYDLSGSAGHFGYIAHPEVGDLISRAKKGIVDAGGPVGTVPHPGRTWQDMFDQGYDMVTGGSDVNFLRDPALATVKDFHSQYNQD